MGKIQGYLATSTAAIITIDDKIMTIPKEHIAELFEQYGGSFTKALGIALYRADGINTLKILTTFDSDVKEFLEKFTFLNTRNEN